MTTPRRQVLAGIAAIPAAVLLGCRGGGANEPRLVEDAWVDVPAGERVAPAPLTGLVPYAPPTGEEPAWAETAPPCGMEYVELSAADVAPADGVFDWGPLTDRLDAVMGRGHRGVVRLFLDSPGKPSGVPGFLADGLDQSRRYDAWGNAGVSFSPDYADHRLQDFIFELVGRFGREFDGDDRLAVLQHGLLGFWGEGHTYPFDGEVSEENPGGLDWSPPVGLRDALAEAWGAALPNTWHQARYPSSVAAEAGAGFHDDSFGHETQGEDGWSFASQLSASGTSNAWRRAPIGGEVWPDLMGCALTAPAACAGLQRSGETSPLLSLAADFHVSWLLADDWFARPVPEEGRAGLGRLAVGLGAAPRLARARIRGIETDPALTVEFVNDGTAPPYWHRWPVTVRVKGEGVVGHGSCEVDWISLAPGGSLTVEVPIDPDATWPASGSVQVRVTDPSGRGVPLGVTASEDGWATVGRLFA